MSGRDPQDTRLLIEDLEKTGAVADGAARSGLRTGELLAIVDGGSLPLVAIDGPEGPLSLRARSLVDLDRRHLGASVALLFEDGDTARAIIIGVFRDECRWPLDQVPIGAEVEADGERLMLTARRELVLRCGKASITLSADGRIEVRGETILTQAERVNRIRGGSVELN